MKVIDVDSLLFYSLQDVFVWDISCIHQSGNNQGPNHQCAVVILTPGEVDAIKEVSKTS